MTTITKENAAQVLIDLNDRLQQLIDDNLTLDPRGLPLVVTGFDPNGSAIVNSKPMRISVKEMAEGTAVRFMSCSSLKIMKEDVDYLEKCLKVTYPLAEPMTGRDRLKRRIVKITAGLGKLRDRGYTINEEGLPITLIDVANGLDILNRSRSPRVVVRPYAGGISVALRQGKSSNMTTLTAELDDLERLMRAPVRATGQLALRRKKAMAVIEDMINDLTLFKEHIESDLQSGTSVTKQAMLVKFNRALALKREIVAELQASQR